MEWSAYSLLIHFFCAAHGITSPYGWTHRRSLEGLWKFKLSPADSPTEGFRKRWWTQSLQGDVLDIPVPSSYNDVTTNRTIRDYLGWVWYQTSEPVDLREWTNYRTVIYFGGVHYYAVVWFGEKLIGEHEGGHIPFEFELEPSIGFITVAVNNTLTNTTIPQGFVVKHQGINGSTGYQTYQHDFDYFDYAGINRHVFIYATSKDIFINDLTLQTDYSPENNTGYISYNVSIGFLSNNLTKNPECALKLYGKDSTTVIGGCNGTFEVKNPTLWWSAFSNHKPLAHLYKLTVEVNPGQYKNGENLYKTQIGIRNIRWDSNTIYLNGEPLYLKGFGKHEDSDLRGRGFDWTTTLRDFELLGWIGANVIRTTHYPPSIEFVEMADKRGLLLIVESPACSLSNFELKIMIRHKEIVKEMFYTYGNHPSVVMWSLANEPVSNKPEAEDYFNEMVTFMKTLDSSRPVTYVTSQHVDNDKGAKFVDVICLNRYNGWYSYSGALERIEDAVTSEVTAWRKKYNVPFIITEYGAGSLPGLHMLPSSMWSEDYQTELLKTHFSVFDKLRDNGDLAGELMWVFADFATPQEYIRPGGCMKGIFTRQRQPKKAAFTIKARYEILNFNASELHNNNFFQSSNKIQNEREVIKILRR